MKPSQRNSHNSVKENFNQIVDSHRLNRFIARKIGLESEHNHVNLVNTITDLEPQVINSISLQVNTQIKEIFKQNFIDTDFNEFINQVTQISQNRLDFLIELFELNQNLKENWPFILPIIKLLPSLELPTHFELIIEIANHNIKLSVIHSFLEQIEVNYNSLYNLYYLATNLDPSILRYIEADSNIFYLDHHKLVHLVKILNRDPFLGRDLILFLNKLSTDLESTISYVSLITNPLITQINQMRFIHTIYKRIDKPFNDKDFIIRIILNEDYITLNFYLGFFKRYNKYEINSFIEKLKSMSLLEKIKLEIGLFTSKISTIKQIING